MFRKIFNFDFNLDYASRQRIALGSVSLLTALVGIVNLLSAVTPHHPSWLWAIEQSLSLQIRETSHLFAAVNGFIFLTLAINLFRKKRVAWITVVTLLLGSIFSHLLVESYLAAIVSVVLLGQLLWLRESFIAQSDRPSITQGIKVLLAALIFTLVYGTIGFWLLDRQFTVRFNLTAALLQTLAMFITEDNAGLQPKTRFGIFFANSIYLVGAFTLMYGLLMLLRPVILRNPARLEERLRARNLIETYGQSALERLGLLEDKSYYFSPGGQSVIAYVAKGRVAIALGDPVGVSTDLPAAVRGFREFCDRHDWHPAFYQTGSKHLSLYDSLGFRAVKIGEEAIIDLASFTLKGKANQNFRTALNKLSNAGFRVEFYPPPVSQSLLDQLEEISDEWLHFTKGAEKRFSVGWFDRAYLQGTMIAVVYTPHGDINAFANILIGGQEVGVDLMRRRQQTENGTMEFLFVSLFQYLQERGYQRFSLGLSALSGVGESPNAPRLEKVLNYLADHLNHFYSFQGIHNFKYKFHPQWEPRYLVYANLPSLPMVVLGLVRADSGDRLWDYLRFPN